MASQIAYTENLEMSILPPLKEGCRGCSINFFSGKREFADLLVISQGKVVYENRVRIRPGVNRISVDLEKLEAGTYDLSLLTPSSIRRKRFRLN